MNSGSKRNPLLVHADNDSALRGPLKHEQIGSSGAQRELGADLAQGGRP